MLKRLELTGFKSFADRTVFDFAAGITAVVGPNGSGKSNVVDAVKWVLGEQSAKSLRSSEMADVIFNGSTSRKGVGVAEVSLTFDNAKSILASPAVEVCVTRRVHRDGRGEYLINGQICRLKDIKDLFLGTGAGSGAYCIIEQGRVDALLQSSVEDRRTIFEEAAGISRFKVKKIECLHRLERVGSNLTRLRDILGEVDQHLNSVRQQATKAQLHRELTTRLKQLRIGLALREYHTLSVQCEHAESQLAELRANLEQQANQSAQDVEAARQIAAELIGLDQAAGVQQQEIDAASAKVTELKAIIQRDQAVAAELESELTNSSSKRQELTEQLELVEKASTKAEQELAATQARSREEDARVLTVSNRVQAIAAELEAARGQLEAAKAEHLEFLQAGAKWQNERVAAQALSEQLCRERDRITNKSGQVADQLAAIDVELAGLTRADSELQNRIAAVRVVFSNKVRDKDSAREETESLQRELAALRAETTGLTTRIGILEGWERDREGLNAGIQEVLDLLNEDDQAPLRDCVIGLVADHLQAPHEIAWLVDLVLGPSAHAFITRDRDQVLAMLQAYGSPLSGRVGFVPLQESLKLMPMPDRCEAARLSDLVECEHPEVKALTQRLLGTTLLVQDLETAVRIAGLNAGWRVITSDGTLIEPDGTVTLGSGHATMGLLSRKSELHRLQTEFAALAERIDSLEYDLEWASERAGESETAVERLREEIDVLTHQESDLRTKLGRHRERRIGLHDDVAISQRELADLDSEIAATIEKVGDADRHAQSCERSAQAVQTQIEDNERSVRALDKEQQAARHEQTAAEVAQAQIRERVQSLADRCESIGRDHADLNRSLLELQARCEAAAARIAECRQNVEAAVAEQDTLRAKIIAAQQELASIVTRRDAIKQREKEYHDKLQSAQNDWQRQRDELHQRELQAGEMRNRRAVLVDRLAEDYQLDLAEVYQVDQAADGAAAKLDDLKDADARTEIDDIRKKLDRLGGVSLDALEELTQIEMKSTALQTQLDDLTQAKASLEEIIHKINGDSKKLFAETFANIRTHFQDLFRQLFDGGLADIVLDKPSDPLESGIEIVARPPGKELRSIALMSGGERTLTAVALLLAIFRSKPSPFCLLDEVDAALDEANTARLAEVIREFATTAQFIIVTHAKRTMSAADVLYGITMQESGISKRVAIRFEDWEGDGRQAA